MHKILLVDDEPDILYVVALLLESEGYAVVTAIDGADGFAKAKVHFPTIVVSDWMMPKLDGNGLFEAIRSFPMLASIPMILVSAVVPQIKIEMHGFLQKPFLIAELVCLINTFPHIKEV